MGEKNIAKEKADWVMREWKKRRSRGKKGGGVGLSPISPSHLNHN